MDPPIPIGASPLSPGKSAAGDPSTERKSPWNLSAGKLTVDMPPEAARFSGVSSEIPTWKQIVAALKRLTNSPGAKAQLAKDLKTSRQNVNKWLSGVGAPSAELTLAVFRWAVEHGGFKQK